MSVNIDEIMRRLDPLIKAVCPPTVSISIGDVTNKLTWRIDAPGATQQQLTAAQAVIDTFNTAARTPRSYYAIYADLAAVPPALGALSIAQKSAIWNDLTDTSGGPSKLAKYTGQGSDTIFYGWRVANNVGLPAAFILDMKIAAVTLYVQGNPDYLVNPSFDPLINIPGDQLAP